MSKWVQAAKRADFDAIAAKYGINSVIARIIRNRDIITDDEYRMYLEGTLDDLHDPRMMTDMMKACRAVRDYIDEGRKIRIIGDYDIDGVCSTYILLLGIRACGGDVDYAIPHRINDGYGLNRNLITAAHEDGREVIITCDNGIAAAAETEYAYELGMKVIVTDHHEVPTETDANGVQREIIPMADAVVDPHRQGDPYPFAGICGAVVAWKLVGVLMEVCGVSEKDAVCLMNSLLEEAAIATVGDVMELKDENRIIVKEGLKRVMRTSNEGLKALIRAVGLSGKKITAYHIGFVIGPCINAVGRLDSASRALELLLCEDESEAAVLANDLKNMNDARKSMTEQGLELAVSDVENSRIGEDRVLVLYLPGIHESLAGIIAGRLREKYEKPVIVMTDSEQTITDEGGAETAVIKGSGRSVEAYDMFTEMSRFRNLYTKFGGHKMAAGVSMPADNLDEFRASLNGACTLTDEDLVTKTVIDVAMPMSYVTRDFVDSLSVLEPFGNGNSKPVFAQRSVSIDGMKVLGKNRNLLIVSVRDESGRRYDLKLFNKTEVFFEEIDGIYGEGVSSYILSGRGTSGSEVVMDVIYYPGINEFNGRSELEFILNDYRFKGGRSAYGR